MFGNLFARLKITVRLYLLIGVAALGIVGVVTMGAYQIETLVANERQEQTRRIVEAAQSVVMGFMERAKAGEFSEEEARKRAVEMLCPASATTLQITYGSMTGTVRCWPTQKRSWWAPMSLNCRMPMAYKL